MTGFLTGTTDPPGLLMALTSSVVALGLSIAAWPIVGHALTIAHEGGHAVMAIVGGGSITRVLLNRDRTGLTVARLPGGPFLFTFAGYLGPSVFGVLGAAVLAGGIPGLVLYVSVVLLALLLIVVRTFFGVVTVIVTGLVMYAAAELGEPGVEMFVACTWVWLLLIGGVSGILRHWPGGQDHGDLNDRNWLPTRLWASLHLLMASGALLAGASLLFGAFARSG